MVKFILVFILVFIATGILASKREAKSFNNGICPKCGSKFRWFDNDSQGGRGYVCDKCFHGTWVSYNRVDKEFRKECREVK